MEPRARRPRRWRAVVLGLAGLVLAVLGCEAIVGDSVPSPVACVDAVGACPAGQECVGGQCAPCTTPSCLPLTTRDAGEDAGHDAGHDVAVPPVDAGHDAGHDVGIDVPVVPEAASPLAVGQSCGADDQCSSGLCVTNQNLNGVDVGSIAVCSQACCTNADCGGGNVCYPTEAGGFCITAAAAGTCGTSCGTACCSKTDCTGGRACALGTTSFGGSVASCEAPPGNGGDGDFCESDSDCQDGLCAEDDVGDTTCVSVNTCCADSQCSDSDVCTWVTVNDSDGTSMPVFRSCLGIDAGSAESGQPCSDPSDCAEGLCLKLPGQTMSLCTQTCCTNANCAGAGERWICEPDSIQLSSDTTVTLLVCGPPS